MSKKQKKQKLAKTIILSDDVFNTCISVFIGSREEIFNSLSKKIVKTEWQDIKNFLFDMGTIGEFRVLEFGEKGVNFRTTPFIWIDEKLFQYGVLAHELLHAVFYYMKKREIPVIKENEEISAYMLMSFINQFDKKWRKICQNTKLSK